MNNTLTFIKNSDNDNLRMIIVDTLPFNNKVKIYERQKVSDQINLFPKKKLISLMKDLNVKTSTIKVKLCYFSSKLRVVGYLRYLTG